MRAIGFYRYLPIEDTESLVDIQKVEMGSMMGKIVLEHFPT